MIGGGIQPGPRTVDVRTEMVEAHTNPSARNPFSIAIVRAIKRMRRHVLGETVGNENNNHVMYVCMVTGRRRMTEVFVQ